MGWKNHFIVALSVLCLAGCGAPYVNIPPLAGDTAFHSPNDNNVLRVEEVALKRVLADHPPVGQYAIALPAGTTSASHHRLLAGLPAGGAAPDSPQSAIPVYRVARVAIRGWNAQVDIVRPSSAGGQLVSVYIGHDMGGWYVVRSRLWRAPLDEALQLAQPDISRIQIPAEDDAEPQAPVEP